jgi:hypothetical protein
VSETKHSRAPHRNRRRVTGEPHQGETHNTRDALTVAVRELCAHRLGRDYGIDTDVVGDYLRRVLPNVVARDTGAEGRGRRLDRRARYAAEMDRKDLIGAAGGPRGVACGKTELAMIWLLVCGVEDVPAATIRAGMSADDAIKREIETMHKALARHGQQIPGGLTRRPRGHRRP